MRIAFLASGEFAVPTLRWLSQSEHDVPLVITQPSRPSGRGRKVTPTPIRKWADDLGLKTLEVEDINASDIVRKLRTCEAHVGLAIAFGQMLGDGVLSAFPGGCINLHASLLPRYRGAAPINWAIIKGEERTGCTVFRIVRKLDAGPILTTRCTAINPEETAGELHDRLAAIGVDAVRAAIPLFENGATPQGEPQDEHDVTLAPKLKKSDGYVRFDRSAADVVDHIHGMTPWPGATAKYESQDGRWEKLTIIRARQAEDPSKPTIEAGTIDGRCFVAAVDGFIEILEVQPSSGRIMPWCDYVNGRHVSAGDKLVPPK